MLRSDCLFASNVCKKYKPRKKQGSLFGAFTHRGQVGSRWPGRRVGTVLCSTSASGGAWGRVIASGSLPLWVCFPPQSVNVVVLPSPGEDVPSCSESQPVLRASHPLSVNTSGPFDWRTTQPKMFTSCQSVEEPSRDVVPVSCLLSDTRLLFHNASKMMFLP